MSRQDRPRNWDVFFRNAPQFRENKSGRKRIGIALALTGLVALSACEEGVKLPFLQPKDQAAPSNTVNNATKLVERDVEAPDVFQVTEAGLWDGRPSIGGVWVAHPEVNEPERVIIRNNANGKFVIGALFRRERAIPGPRLQVSSDAASALSMLAGAPVELNVTALRKEVIDPAPESESADGEVSAVAMPSDVDSQPLDPIAGAAAAIEATAAPAAPPAPAPQAQSNTATQRSALDKPYIQIGIFSIEANANRTADQMRNAGIIPTIYEQSINDKPFWRVVVGPAQSKTVRNQLLKSVKDAGFSDAYAVTN